MKPTKYRHAGALLSVVVFGEEGSSRLQRILLGPLTLATKKFPAQKRKAFRVYDTDSLSSSQKNRSLCHPVSWVNKKGGGRFLPGLNAGVFTPDTQMIRWLPILLLVTLFALPACTSTDNQCGDGECKTNADCSDKSKVCKDCKCVAVSCASDKDCKSGLHCKASSKACVPCTKDDHCAVGEACDDKTNQCKALPKCKEDKDCKGTDQVCVNDVCIAKCKEDKDCTDATRNACREGRCVDPSVCRTDNDCNDPKKPLCKENKCSELTFSKIGEVCDQQPCEKDLVCYSDIGKRYCRKSCDPYNPICGGGTTCAYIGGGKGACVPRNNGAFDGDQCDAKPCEKNLTCVEWNKGISVCARPCRADKDDCTDKEVCHNIGTLHVCLPKPDQCGPGRPCPDEKKWDCVKSQCLPKSCPRVPCGAGEICKAGSCQPANCCRGDVCPTGKLCNNNSGQCVSLTIKVPFCDPCGFDGKCLDPGTSCIELTGKDDRLCASECTVSRKCDDPLMECRVSTKDKKRYFCVPKLGTCNRDACKDVKCKDNEICLPTTKKCVPIKQDVCKPCEFDFQCGGPTDLCIKKEGEKTGYCAKDCGGCARCGTGFRCQDVGKNKLCLPIGGKCPTP